MHGTGLRRSTANGFFGGALRANRRQKGLNQTNGTREIGGGHRSTSRAARRPDRNAPCTVPRAELNVCSPAKWSRPLNSAAATVSKSHLFVVVAEYE
jgi:hypothetical protein